MNVRETQSKDAAPEQDAMHKTTSEAPAEEDPGKTIDPPKPKKNAQLTRTLLAHDLDSLLVYEKRQRVPAISRLAPPAKNPQTKAAKPKLKAEVKQQKIQKKEQEREKQAAGYRVSAVSQNKATTQRKEQPNEANQAQCVIKKNCSSSFVPPSKIEEVAVREPAANTNRELPPPQESSKLESVPQSTTLFDAASLEPPNECIRINPPLAEVKPITIAEKTQGESNQAQKEVHPIYRPRRKAVRKRQQHYSDDSDFSGKPTPTEFPIANYIAPEVQSKYLHHAAQVDEDRLCRREQGHILNSSTFISCDVKYFNWNFFVDRVGNFEVVLIDPPWRIKGAQQNDSQFMFSNCKFNLEYNTMSNKDIAKVGIDKLSDCGFIFLWILNTQLDASIEILNGWGYELIDQIVWVKTKDNKIYLTHGYYFMHSYELCLIGYKEHPTKRVGCLPYITSNVLIAEVRKKSQKPDELYELIELMFPATKKIEIYARNNNLRFGWFSLGNQLGESYDKWLLMLHCDKCHIALSPNTVRYKAKRRANYDLCEACMTDENRSDFFQILNQADEDVIHLYRSCDHCGIEPIWGTRFECLTCQNFDLCENCYDLNLNSEEKFHDLQHEIAIVEIPIFGHGFNLHDFKCNSCFQKPIIGICFSCKSCRYNLCQMCFFQRNVPHPAKPSREEHQLEAIFDPNARPVEKKFSCFSCKNNLTEVCWMCENCYGFFFCEECYRTRSTFKTQQASSHKSYHHFARIF